MQYHHFLAVFFDLFSENFSHNPLNPYFSIPLTMFLLLSSSSSTLCKKLNSVSKESLPYTKYAIIIVIFKATHTHTHTYISYLSSILPLELELTPVPSEANSEFLSRTVFFFPSFWFHIIKNKKTSDCVDLCFITRHFGRMNFFMTLAFSANLLQSFLNFNPFQRKFFLNV